MHPRLRDGVSIGTFTYLKQLVYSIRYDFKKLNRAIKRRFAHQKTDNQAEEPSYTVLTINYIFSEEKPIYCDVVDKGSPFSQVLVAPYCDFLSDEHENGYKKAVCYIIRSDIHPIAKFIMQTQTFENLFSEYEPDELPHRINQFRNLESSEQNLFLAIANSTFHAPIEQASKIVRPVINSIPSLDRLFALLHRQSLLPPKVYSTLKELREEMGDSFRGKQRPETVTAYRVLLNLFASTVDPPPPVPCYGHLLSSLKAVHEGDNDILESLVQQIRLHARNKKGSGFAVVFAGPPGTGKTSLARALAECMARPFNEIKCRNLTGSDLLGINRFFEGAVPGKLANALLPIGLQSVLVLDEFDKAAIGTKEGNPYHCFDSILDDRAVLCDTFLEVEIPVSETIFIFCVNELSTIPQTILSRLEGNIFCFSTHDRSRKLDITSRYIIPQLLSAYNFSSDEIVFEKSGIEALLRDSLSLRGVSKLGTHVLAVANNLVEAEKKRPIIIDADFVKAHIPSSLSSHTQKIGF